VTMSRRSWFLFVGLLCRHTVSNLITGGTQGMNLLVRCTTTNFQHGTPNTSFKKDRRREGNVGAYSIEFVQFEGSPNGMA